MRRWFPLIVLFLAVPSYADLIFTATLLPGNEVPPHVSEATGFISVDLHSDMITLDVSESFFNLSSPATASHLYCCGPAGTNQPVELIFTGFPVAISGAYTNTFDLNTDLLNGMTAATFITALENGDVYANIHDAVFPGGEIRGQLEPVVPEPGSLLLTGSGLLGIAATVRRKFRR